MSEIENQEGSTETMEKADKASDLENEIMQNIEPLAAQAEESAPAEEEGDGDISWDDAFKEEASANETVPKNSPAAPAPVLDTENIDTLDTEARQSERVSKDETVKRSVKKVEFAQFDETDKTTEAPKNLDFILDIPLTISVELGRTKMVINDMLQLGQGSVLELVKLAGEPLDVYVNGKLMARGEVVLVNDKFGVRLTDIISPAERIKKL